MKKLNINEEQIANVLQQVCSLTAKQKSQIKKKSYDVDDEKFYIQCNQGSGQTGFTRSADPEYKRGLKKLVQSPMSTILPQKASNTLRRSYELSNHLKAGAAIQIINLLKMTKQRFMTEQPEYVRSDSAIDVSKVSPGSEIMRGMESVKKRIKRDTELAYVFERIDEMGLYVNPAR